MGMRDYNLMLPKFPYNRLRVSRSEILVRSYLPFVFQFPPLIFPPLLLVICPVQGVATTYPSLPRHSLEVDRLELLLHSLS